MTLKTIKNIREEKWAELKSMAARQHLPIGKLIENMIEVYEKHTDTLWNEILHGEKLLSDKEAKELRKTTQALRKIKWFHE